MREPYLFESVNRFLRKEATVEELADVADGWGVNIDKLVRLINRKQIEVIDEDVENYQRKLKEEKRSKNAIKRAKRRAEKEAAKQSLS